VKRNPLVCRGVMILGGCVYEDGDTFEVRAECDDLAGCGYDEHLTEFDNDTTWTLTSDEFIDLHNRHLAHSRGEQLEERKWEI
jgi:hypothetical protein